MGREGGGRPVRRERETESDMGGGVGSDKKARLMVPDDSRTGRTLVGSCVALCWPVTSAE